MKTLILASAAASMLLAGAGVASAQWRDHNQNDQGSYDRRDGDQSSYDRRDGDQRNYDRRGDEHRDWRDHNGQGGWSGRGWNSEWRRGGRIDRDYWSRGSRIDWRAHHLRRPPYGYEWRYVDGRYVMAAVATGIIADIIMNSR